MHCYSNFRPPWWLRNPHLQTIWAGRIQRVPVVSTTTERITTPDDDFLDLEWTNNTRDQNNLPTVLLTHGLAGSVKSHYIQTLMHVLPQHGFRAVLMHFRGCSGEPNRKPHAYHSGHTHDISFILDRLKHQSSGPVFAVGYSLGGNALLKYLATNANNPLHFAISVCPPLALAEGARRINTGFSRIYQRMLLKGMKAAVRDKHAMYPQFQLNKLQFESAKNFIEFDDRVTAPLHGFEGVDDYYKRASTLHDLINIKTDTHIIWADDDPFFTKRCVPTTTQLPKSVVFETATHGGHVGFVDADTFFGRDNWLANRICNLLSSHQLQTKTNRCCL